MSQTFSTMFQSPENVKVKWKEPYVSEGLNAKMAVNTPRGIYRGFKLAAHVSDRTINVAHDATSGDSVAVYEVGSANTTATKYSLTIRFKGSFSLNLTAFAGQTVYVTLFASYTSGNTTTASMKVYTVAEFTALTAAVREELVVLGTCVVPASAGPIVTFNSLGRTSAWQNNAPEAIPWIPALQNGGFEVGVVGDATFVSSIQTAGRYLVAPWELNAVGTGRKWTVTTSDAQAGTKSLVAASTVSGTAVNCKVKQSLMKPVRPGSKARISLSKRTMQSHASSIMTVTVDWGSTTGASLTPSVYTIPLTSTDAGYVDLDSEVTVPAGAVCIRHVEIAVSTITSSVGDIVKIDSVQLWVETISAEDTNSVERALRPILIAPALLLESSTASTFADAGGAIRYDSTITTEGAVSIERKDQTTGRAVNLSLAGRLVNLGARHLDTIDIAAGSPRISGPVALGDGTYETLTLISEWASPSGSTKYRTYMNAIGEPLTTVNCSWNNTDQEWSIDDSALRATMTRQTADGFLIYGNDPDDGSLGITSWGMDDWSDKMIQVSQTTGITIGESVTPLNDRQNNLGTNLKRFNKISTYQTYIGDKDASLVSGHLVVAAEPSTFTLSNTDRLASYVPTAWAANNNHPMWLVDVFGFSRSEGPSMNWEFFYPGPPFGWTGSSTLTFIYNSWGIPIGTTSVPGPKWLHSGSPRVAFIDAGSWAVSPVCFHRMDSSAFKFTGRYASSSGSLSNFGISEDSAAADFRACYRVLGGDMYLHAATVSGTKTKNLFQGPSDWLLNYSGQYMHFYMQLIESDTPEFRIAYLIEVANGGAVIAQGIWNVGAELVENGAGRFKIYGDIDLYAHSVYTMMGYA